MKEKHDTIEEEKRMDSLNSGKTKDKWRDPTKWNGNILGKPTK